MVEGSWTEEFKIGGKVYWDFRFNNLVHVRPVQNALPSDSRFREDSYYLLKGNLAKAAEHKLKMEVKQRRDKALRLNQK